MESVTVAILAGGRSDRFKPSKALIQIAGKPLFLHVVDACEAHASEVIIIVHSKADQDLFSKYISKDQILTDENNEMRCPLVGAFTAFQHAKSPYTQLLPCDSPLIHNMFFEILWNMVENHHAAVPRWPNGWVEPLHSVYATDIARDIATQCLEAKEYRMQCLIKRIGRVIYLSTTALERFDKKLLTFTNVNTPADLRRIENALRHQPPR
ncbi:MAG: molybdenum cofactor guanylyltransferase [Promethearchaeota archaeon]